jgi:hypothetical protein
MKGTTTAIILTSTTAVVSAFSVLPATQHMNTNAVRTKTELYGLFDGVKEAFSQPPTELEAGRETPIDRWMGWSVVSENEVKEIVVPAGTLNKAWMHAYSMMGLISKPFPDGAELSVFARLFHRLTKIIPFLSFYLFFLIHASGINCCR